MPVARRHRPVPLLFAVVVLALAGVACGDDDDDTEAVSTTTTTTAVEESTTTAVTGGAPPPAGNAATIEMKDHAFAVTGSLQAGVGTVAMKNTGQELHMAGFFLLKDGKSVADVQKALSSEDEDAGSDVFAKELDAPGGLLSPGQSQEVTTPFLTAGKYALICFIPTAGEETQHFEKGMVATTDVAAGNATAAPQPTVTYTVNDGKLDGPTSLKPGRTTIQVNTAGKGPHEFFVLRKRDPATTYEMVDQAFTALFESETPPAPGYAEEFPVEIAANTFDVETGKTVFVALDLPPGSYIVGCGREADEDEGGAAQDHRGETLEVTVAA